MERNKNQNEKRPYVKPEGEMIALRLQENIAASDNSTLFLDEFNGEDDVFD